MVTAPGLYERRSTAPRAVIALLGILLTAGASPAQTLQGRVVDGETGIPLPGASVQVDGGAPGFITDANGEFRAELPDREVQVTIRLIGYSLGVFRLRASASSTDRTFPLDFNGHRLPDVVVRARAEQLMPRYLDFETRRQRKLGAFFRWDEMRDAGFSSVSDALRTVRGVRIQCNQQTFECLAVMARAPRCHPTWWIDGMEVNSFHENTPIRDIYGIEIYRGAGEIPGEFSGSNAACGVIVIWTKSRPFR